MSVKNAFIVSRVLFQVFLKRWFALIAFFLVFINGFVQTHRNVPFLINFINNSGSEMNYIFLIIPLFCVWYAWSMSGLDRAIKPHLFKRGAYVVLTAVNAAINTLMYSLVLGVSVLINCGLQLRVPLPKLFSFINLYTLFIWVITLTWYLFLVGICMSCLNQFTKSPILTMLISIFLISFEGLMSFFTGSNILVFRLLTAANLKTYLTGGLVGFSFLFLGLSVIAIIILSEIVHCKDWLSRVEHAQ